MTRVKKSRKLPDKFTSKDVYSYWCTKYKDYFGTDYNPRGFIGSELQRIKEALDFYNVYALLLSIDSGLSTGGESSLGYFLSNIDDYMPTTEYPHLYYWVRNQGEELQKDLLMDLMMLESRWIPDPMDNKKISSVAEKLSVWVEKITA